MSDKSKGAEPRSKKKKEEQPPKKRKEEEPPLKKIVNNEKICAHLFDLLPPVKVAQFALLSHKADEFVDLHFHTRRWTIGKLEIVDPEENDVEPITKLNKDKSSESLTIPQTPLPNAVVGFGRILCQFFTTEISAFLQRLSHLCQVVEFNGPADFLADLLENPVSKDFLSTLLSPSVGIVQMHFEFGTFLHALRLQISQSVLRDCANLRFVNFREVIDLQFPPDDSAQASGGQAMCKWLHTPRDDGQPHVLKCHYSPFGRNSDSESIKGLKNEFRNASTGVSFIIIFYEGPLVPFEEENLLTNEIMKSWEHSPDEWVIVRCPIQKNDQWAKWEREAIEEEGSDWNVLEFSNR